MAVGGRTDLCLAESIPPAARSVRKAGRHTRGIPLARVCSDLLEVSPPDKNLSRELQASLFLLPGI